MKTYKHLYERCLLKENIKAAIIEAARRKHKRKDVIKVLDNIDKEVDVVYDMLINHSFKPSLYVPHTIKDGTKDKLRQISKPKFKYDQIMAHVIVDQLKPIVLKSLYHHVYGSIEGKGQLQCKKAIEKCIRKDPAGTKYCGQGDARRFYYSIDQDILHNKLVRKIKDDDFMIEADKFVYHAPDKGIPLGDPTSVWYGHFYLSDMDHFITSLDGVKHYIRLADDFVIFGNNKKKIHKAMIEIKRYMYEELHLKLKFNWQVFRLDYIDRYGNRQGRFLDINGYRFYRDRTTLRKSNLIHATRKANKIINKERATILDARQMNSHLARLKTADAYSVYERFIKGKISVKGLRSKISSYDRKERENELERSGRFSGREAVGI